MPIATIFVSSLLPLCEGARDRNMATVYTIGHSTREGGEFAAILTAYGIQTLVDVRRMPTSRHVPQFNAEALESRLREHGIDYLHTAELGGRRHTSKDSVNLAWKNLSFRGYADYMQTSEFASGLEKVIALAEQRTIAIMCAEAVPWRCHRSLVGDALLARGLTVIDILDGRNRRPHVLTPFARISDGRVTYPE